MGGKISQEIFKLQKIYVNLRTNPVKNSKHPNAIHKMDHPTTKITNVLRFQVMMWGRVALLVNMIAKIPMILVYTFAEIRRIMTALKSKHPIHSRALTPIHPLLLAQRPRVHLHRVLYHRLLYHRLRSLPQLFLLQQ